MGDLEAARERLGRRRRYRRLFYGVLAVGVLGYFVVVGAWTQVGGDILPFVAVGVYWLAFFAALGVYYLGPVELEDERDHRMSARAADLTVYVFVFVLVLGAPGVATLEQTEVYTAPSWYWGAMGGYALLFVVYALAYGYVKRQYS